MTFIYTCQDNSSTHANFQSDLSFDERMGMYLNTKIMPFGVIPGTSTLSHT